MTPTLSFEKICNVGRSNTCILESNLWNVWIYGMTQKHPQQSFPEAMLPALFVKKPCSKGLLT